ncbi:hypothetical protein D0962_22925 [Leptolyngbyaceae cyanobacterium CCMR0082]|uniref:Polynucleotide kinase n=1 Tax=Adonisia turfae CCMR0082 TaxID=2304604 RepID=A0A6M0SBX6_9CYAN|nr:AAA family ATPase [Adonisia turfae]NEZ65573.1 hypothetical protein [Adonisia turfae CCMR0082]
MDKRFYIARGASGSGKTAFLEQAFGKEAVVAADDFPGLYDADNKYQLDKQAASHEWCRAKIEMLMQQGITPLALGNTNMKLAYIKPYLAMAKKYGYSTQVIHFEGIILPDGSTPQNSHGTPEGVIRSQLAGFQLMNPPVSGITVEETCAGLHAMSRIDSVLVISDLVGTLIRPGPTHRFINQADHAEPIESVLQSLMDHGVRQIAIASNQMGVGGGHFAQSELEKLSWFTKKWLAEYKIELKYAVYAIQRNSEKALIYENGQLSKLFLAPRADKPSCAMHRYIMVREDAAEAVYLGDAHHTGRAEDVEAVRAFDALRMNLTYIPVEVLGG